MTRILAVARNTVREAARERVALMAVLFGLGLVAASHVLSPLALGEGKKVVTDFGLAGASLLASLLAITLGSTLLHKELERRTILALMAKPLRRAEFVLGKYLGLWVTVCALLAAMTGVLGLVLSAAYRSGPGGIVPSFLLTAAELLVVAAAVVLYSSFTTPGLTALFAAATLVAGHFAEDLLYFGSRGGSEALAAATTAVYWVLPHLSVFNARGLVSHGLAIPPERLLFAVAYALLYSGALLALACAIFGRREFR